MLSEAMWNLVKLLREETISSPSPMLIFLFDQTP